MEKLVDLWHRVDVDKDVCTMADGCITLISC